MDQFICSHSLSLSLTPTALVPLAQNTSTLRADMRHRNSDTPFRPVCDPDPPPPPPPLLPPVTPCVCGAPAPVAQEEEEEEEDEEEGAPILTVSSVSFT
jgi:hypothetical protein